MRSHCACLTLLTVELFCEHYLQPVMPQEKSSTDITFYQVRMLTFTWLKVHELMTNSQSLSRYSLLCLLDWFHLTFFRHEPHLCCYWHLLLKSEPDILQENEEKGITHPSALHVMSMTELIQVRDREGSTQATKESHGKQVFARLWDNRPIFTHTEKHRA